MTTPADISDKLPLSVVMLGSQDGGKSTATGHLVYKSGLLHPDLISKFDAHTAGGALDYAWLMDTIRDQLGGIAPNSDETVPPEAARFVTPRYIVQVMDVPGHRDFMRNVLTGASRADAAILVLSARPGELETALGLVETEAGHGAEARQHATLAFTMGVTRLVVAVNKMDMVDWSEARFKEVVEAASAVLRTIGFAVEKIAFVPIAGVSGDNLLTPSANMPWYQGWSRQSKDGTVKTGMTLIEAMDAVDPPRRLADKPLRIVVQDVYKVSRLGTVPVGRIESGMLRVGMRVRFAPGGVEGTVQTIERDSSSSPPGHTVTDPNVAGPGENVGFSVSDVSVRDIRRGYVASSAAADQDPAYEAASLTVSMVMMADHQLVLTPGCTPVVDVHTAHVPVKVVELVTKIDRSNGQILERAPKALRPGEAGVVKLVPQKPLCVEAFAEYAALGRFALRDQRHTVAVGVIKRVEKVC
ncbi:translation elongation factor EF-1, subunit alpha [Allomyces macrogynus ATCC 38327]|uniref:Translation elongation factor EF-1, subunit alpha n=1 Tax=Allomyces macrogynus (strain ATCC 38327) TaxID=578462 RepID=A0A0L0S204_ALLM3|nr:translation elongation factor EF-1, subunit alpha [Allomyces macrogynus ATCC 38327]|eukprot:KNE56431.1 translation elongation factor EF-1, subunit alpha [Allomyces macrogynus ATCC 38327]